MLSFPLNNERQVKEWHTILHIAKTNNFPATMIHKLKRQIQHKTKHPPPDTNKKNNAKWTTFTFFSPQICRITNLFKHTNPKIPLRCHNTIARLTKPDIGRKTLRHDKGGIYQLSCKTCNLSYVGQTSRSIEVRYQEHVRYIRTNNPQSAFA